MTVSSGDADVVARIIRERQEALDRIRALEAEVARLKRYLNEEPALPEEREAVE